MIEMSILVTGATGTVGSQVVEKLNAKGIGVKALTRNENTVGIKGVHYVVGDLNKPKTIHPHLKHIKGLFLLTQSEQTEEMFIANKEIINMAKSAGVRKLVAIMDYKDNPIEEVIKKSGLEWTILRPVEFMKNVTYDWVESIQKEGVVRTAFPDNLSARIHDTDLAEVVTLALTEETHNKKEYDLTGPEALSQRAMIDVLSDVINKPIELIPLSEDELLKEWKAKGYDEDFINYFIIEMGKNPPKEVYTVLPTIEDITNRPAKSFREWAEENKSLFSKK